MIRMSGPEVASVLAALVGVLPEPRRASLRRLRHPRGGSEVIDRAMVLWFPAPASYTGEPCGELHVHGGPAVVAALAEALVDLGLRPAEPGEFTRRAFAHGKLDLLAAEGIADLIEAETEAQRRQAMQHVDGALSAVVAGWLERLVGLLARQEVAIEFDTEDLPPELEREVADAVVVLAEELQAHLSVVGRAERLRSGVRIAILGAPNAGKSSLLNVLAGRPAAIVSPTPGTTRDVIEARLVVAGIPVVLADTAGLRDATDPIEREGIRRARDEGAFADLTLLVFAADMPFDEATLGQLGPRSLVVVSKTDLARPSDMGLADAGQVCPVSIVTGSGLELLRKRLGALVTSIAGPASGAAFSRPRHRAGLSETIGWLRRVPGEALPEVRAEALRAALEALGRLGGRVGVEQVLDEVFGSFCIGK